VVVVVVDDGLVVGVDLAVVLVVVVGLALVVVVVLVVVVSGVGWSSGPPQSCHSHSGATDTSVAGFGVGLLLDTDFGFGFAVVGFESGRFSNSSQLLPKSSFSRADQAAVVDGDAVLGSCTVFASVGGFTWSCFTGSGFRFWKDP
jgi:hypothetical protein